MVDKLPFLPDEHHYAIAAVAVRAAILDHRIEEAIYAFLPDHHETAAFLLDELSWTKFPKLLRRVMLDGFPGEAPEIEKLYGRIVAARSLRNDLLHWLWRKSDDPDMAILARMPPHKPGTKRAPLSAADVAAVADELLAVTRELGRLIRRRWKQEFPPLPSPDTREPLSPPLDSASPSGSDHPENPGPRDLLRKPSPE